MIKFLHCADLHLDSPLSGLDLQRSEVRRNEIRAAFTSMTMYVRMNHVDFLIISGDFFESGYVTKETCALILREFEAIPDCRIIIAPGNHDPYTSQSFYRRTKFPPNVYVFSDSSLTSFDFPDKNTTVYGYAFCDSRLESCPFADAQPENPERINILVAHGMLGTSTSDSCPIPFEVLKNCRFDYVALGHIHEFTEIRKIGESYFCYSGCLEGRGFDECGPKGAVIGAAEKKNSKLEFGGKFVRFSKRCYEIEKLDISGAETNTDVVEKIASLIGEKHYSEETALRVILTGRVSGDLMLAPKYIEEQFPRLFLLEIKNETLPLLDSEKLKSDPTVRGAFYRALLPMLESDDPEERELASSALMYGLSALSGGDIADF